MNLKNHDQLSQSGLIINPTPTRPNENFAKGKLYSKNKVSAIINREKSQILMNAENTYYTSRFNNLERDLITYSNKQNEVHTQISSKIEKLKEFSNQIKAETVMTLSTKTQMSNMLKSLKIIKNKIEKLNVSTTGKLNKAKREDEKTANIKVNVIKKYLKNIFNEGEEKIDQIKIQVKEHLDQLRKKKKSKSKNKKTMTTQSGSFDQDKERKRHMKKYLNISKKIINEYGVSLRSDFNLKLENKRNIVFSKIMEHLEKNRAGRSSSHGEIYTVVRNTQLKVQKMLASRMKIDLSY